VNVGGSGVNGGAGVHSGSSGSGATAVPSDEEVGDGPSSAGHRALGRAQMGRTHWGPGTSTGGGGDGGGGGTGAGTGIKDKGRKPSKLVPIISGELAPAYTGGSYSGSSGRDSVGLKAGAERGAGGGNSAPMQRQSGGHEKSVPAGLSNSLSSVSALTRELSVD